ncbi:protease SohB, partial [Planctomycetota bacterium]
HELRQLVSALLGLATENDEIVVRLESAGGMVNAYGLAASQLARIRAKEIPLTVCIDKIAASGGYLVACQADRVLAAPFAIIGSIGVVAPVPNVHRLLESHGVDYEEFTAGDFKRPVSFFGKISEKGREKLQEQLEDTHTLFKEAVSENRRDLAIEEVATGEYWFGKRAKELNLVDEIMTSDDYLLQNLPDARILHVVLEDVTSLSARLAQRFEATLERTVVRALTRLLGSRYA